MLFPGPHHYWNADGNPYTDAKHNRFLLRFSRRNLQVLDLILLLFRRK
jgi:hypothetical protein